MSTARAERGRRLVKLLVVVDIVLVAVAIVVWVALRSAGDERANAVNDGLRGSRPPAGRALPELGSVPTLVPAAPGRDQLVGDATMIVATCLSCRSGDIIGGLLGRMREGDVPDGARIVLVGWDGDPEAWRARWGVGAGDDAAPVTVLHARGALGMAAARELFGVGPVADAEESGIAYLYDTRGRQRSTYFIGQLDRDDIAHDLRILDRD